MNRRDFLRAVAMATSLAVPPKWVRAEDQDTTSYLPFVEQIDGTEPNMPTPTQHHPHPQRRHGLLGHRLLRRRDPDAEPGRAGRGRAALHAVLQHGALLPVAGVAADRPVPAPGGRGPHDGRRRHRRLPGRPDAATASPSPRRCSAAGYATYMSGKWHVTRHRATGPKHNWPLPARLRRLLRHHHRRGQLLRAAHADAATTSASSPRATITSSPTPSATRRCGRSASTQRSGADSPSSCTSPTPRRTGRCTRTPEDIARYRGRFDAGWDALREERLRAHGRDGHRRRGLAADASAIRRVPPWEDEPTTRSGRRGAWRSTPRRSTAWTRASAASSTRCGRPASSENTLILFLADNGGCAEELTEATGAVGDARRSRWARSSRATGGASSTATTRP